MGPDVWDITCELGDTEGLVPTSWEDVSSRVRSRTISTDVGRRDEWSQPDTSTVDLSLDNEDGKWDPGIDPHRPMRLSVSDGTTTVQLAYGLIEAAPDVWPARGLDRRVDVTLADPFTLLARDELDLDRPYESTGARIGAILDAAGWPAGMRDLDTGVVDVEAVEGTANAADEIRDVARYEDGVVWAAPDGTITFRDRHARLTVATAATFQMGAGQTFDSLEPFYSDEKLLRAVRMEQADGTVYEQEDVSAPSTYRVLIIRDQPVPWYEANGIASWRLTNYTTPTRRYSKLSVPVGSETSLLDLGDVIRVVHTLGGSTVADDLVHVERVQRAASPNGVASTYTLSPYFGAGPWLILDDPVYGQLDAGNRWAP